MPGNDVSCAFAAQRRPLPSICRLLLELERLVYGFGANGATDPVETALRALPKRPAGEVDVVINFSGEELLTAGGRVLTPLFNGVPGEIGIMAALVNDQDLLVDLHDTARPSSPWTARPASADREVFAASLDGALSCTVALILKALREEAGAAASGVRGARTTSPQLGTLSALAWATGTVASKAVKFVDILARGGKTWAIGWRFDEATSLLDKGDATFRVLTGDANSFLADPFPFRHQGRDFIFVEQYLNTKSRGCIAVVTADRNGATTAPQIVLEEPYHLSYPFVFEQDGQIWMIPESGAARNVSLYRAVEFPHRWTREACLVEGIECYDATPLHHAGAFWFFVSPGVWGSTSWDVLSLYRAEGLTGAWTPHAENPVLIDATLSRPAGAFIRRGGRTLRPVQDCSRRYGGGVTFCQIDALDRLNFAQTPVGRMQCGTFGCHTYNRQSDLEVIDLLGHVRGLREVTACYGAFASRPPAAHGQAPVLADTDLAALRK
ncbi:glucosamine inositolphosphorylceramide transferase family protein [Bradyrhizobium sp. AZCC 2289]|uniref:glucosamine inositolphosphorylceramide transferase family protein n=1 Tax=Bradyrhizobium sp. AZCC 2289 TaxID=3117026 RepID=UPI002FF2C017